MRLPHIFPRQHLISSYMIQQRNGLEEVDRSTFARFCHWAYAGFYRAAEAFNRLQDMAPAR